MLEQDDPYDKFDFFAGSGLSTYVGGSKPVFLIPTTYHLTVGVDQEEEEKLTGMDYLPFKTQFQNILKVVMII